MRLLVLLFVLLSLPVLAADYTVAGCASESAVTSCWRRQHTAERQVTGRGQSGTSVAGQPAPG